MTFDRGWNSRGVREGSGTRTIEDAWEKESINMKERLFLEYIAGKWSGEILFFLSVKLER